MTPLQHIHPNLYIGDDTDARAHIRQVRVPGCPWRETVTEGWAILHAAKSPWHADMVGYHNGAAPAESPERWVAQRERRMALNLVDAAPTPPHTQTVLDILSQAAEFISVALIINDNVLVHCNMGLSRSPACVLWWMNQDGSYPYPTFEDAMNTLLLDHPYVKQDSGIIQLVRDNWRTPTEN